MKNVNNDKKKYTHSKQIQQQNQHILSEKKGERNDKGNAWRRRWSMEVNRSQWQSIELVRIWYDDKLYAINKAHDE